MALPPPAVNDLTTLVEYDQVSCLCSSNHTPNIMTGVILRLLREHFSRSENLIYTRSFEGKECMERMIWTPDNKTTSLQIQPSWAYNTQNIQQRPGIYVKRGPWKTEKLAINDGFTINASKLPSGEIGKVNGEYQSRMVLGSHTIICVGREGTEVEDIAGEVFDFMLSFSSIFRSDLKLHRFEVSELGPIVQVPEHKENFTVTITISYAAAWAWSLNLIAPWFQKLSIDLEPNKC